MPNPNDLKVLFKQVLTDPMGLNLPTLPSTAIIIGNARGEKGNWTGVYGRSERSVAIYGESPVYAGFFQGDVHINGQLTLESGDARIGGNLTVTGNLSVHGQSINQLVQRVAELEQQGAELGQVVESVSSLAQRVSSLEQKGAAAKQKIADLESQLHTAVSNLTGRVTQTEVAISGLRSDVQQIISKLG